VAGEPPSTAVMGLERGRDASCLVTPFNSVQTVLRRQLTPATIFPPLRGHILSVFPRSSRLQSRPSGTSSVPIRALVLNESITCLWQIVSRSPSDQTYENCRTLPAAGLYLSADGETSISLPPMQQCRPLQKFLLLTAQISFIKLSI